MCRKNQRTIIKYSIMAGKVVILSAPSGSGKTTLARHLLSIEKLNFKFSVSATTRKKRDHEINGKDYFFFSQEEFKNSIDNQDFIEYEKVYEDMYYGTLKSEVNNLIVNHNIVFDVDVIGALSLKKYFKSLSISIFIKPPSIDILEKRLIDREKNDPSEIKERVGKAEIEMKKEADFDSVIINEDLDVAKQELIDKVERFLK
ncbi:MAG: guanylate kinase [Cryomorphaceae bacterium]|nr:MAG: guanylate kinase [Cryomorphaceae bacterium]